jgi:hypothetical protein
MVCVDALLIYTNHYNDVPTLNSVGTDSFGVGIPSKASTQTITMMYLPLTLCLTGYTYTKTVGSYRVQGRYIIVMVCVDVLLTITMMYLP